MLLPQLAYFKEAGGGAIVNTVSMAAIKATKDVTAYAVSEWGVVGLTKQAALESVEDDIPVNAIAPGVIKTAIFGSTPENKMQEFESMQPGGYLGEPDEMNEVVGFLLSDDASYINVALVPYDMGGSAF